MICDIASEEFAPFQFELRRRFFFFCGLLVWLLVFFVLFYLLTVLGYLFLSPVEEVYSSRNPPSLVRYHKSDQFCLRFRHFPAFCLMGPSVSRSATPWSPGLSSRQQSCVPSRLLLTHYPATRNSSRGLFTVPYSISSIGLILSSLPDFP